MSRYDENLPEYRLTEVHAYWKDADKKDQFLPVQICRLDDPWNREFYDSLMLNPDPNMFDAYDSEIFYYTATQGEFDELFDPNNPEDFYIKEIS